MPSLHSYRVYLDTGTAALTLNPQGTYTKDSACTSVTLGQCDYKVSQGRAEGFTMNDMAQFVGNLNLAKFVARLRVEREPTTRSSLHRLLLKEANNLGFNLGQPGSLQRTVIEGRARIAIQIAVVETLSANGQDVRLAKIELEKLSEIQSIVEQYRQVIVDAVERNERCAPALSKEMQAGMHRGQHRSD